MQINFVVMNLLEKNMNNLTENIKEHSLVVSQKYVQSQETEEKRADQ